MKKLFLLLIFIVNISLVSCEKPDLNEDSSEIKNVDPELFSINKEDIIRPGDDPTN